MIKKEKDILDVLYPLQEDENIDELICYLRKVKDKRGSLVFWLGAGISKLTGYPLWKELVNQLVQIYCQSLDPYNYKHSKRKQLIERFEKDGKFEEILEIIKSGDEKFFERNVKKIFKGVEQNPNRDLSIFYVISKFIRHGVRIITTNLDMELENILRKDLKINEEQISIVPKDGGGSLDKYIYYLHGRIDKPDSWILTDKYYASAYNNEPRVCNKFLEGFLNQLEALVIMGYSLSEKEIYRKFLTPVVREDLKIFWIQLLDTFKKKEEFKEHVCYFTEALKLSIKPIPYKKSEDLIDLLNKIYTKAYEPNVKEYLSNESDKHIYFSYL